MNKEIEALERLKEYGVNIRLVFLRDLLDQLMTEKRVAKEYTAKYKALSEIQKWEVAMALEKAYKYNTEAWNDEIQYAIDVMETKYYNEQD